MKYLYIPFILFAVFACTNEELDSITTPKKSYYGSPENKPDNGQEPSDGFEIYNVSVSSYLFTISDAINHFNYIEDNNPNIYFKALRSNYFWYDSNDFTEGVAVPLREAVPFGTNLKLSFDVRAADEFNVTAPLRIAVYNFIDINLYPYSIQVETLNEISTTYNDTHNYYFFEGYKSVEVYYLDGYYKIYVDYDLLFSGPAEEKINFEPITDIGFGFGNGEWEVSNFQLATITEI